MSAGRLGTYSLLGIWLSLSPGVTPMALADGVGFEAYRQIRAPHSKAPKNPHPHCFREFSVPGDEEVSYCPIPEIYQFKIINRGSPRINPIGKGVRREYEFLAPDLARRELRLEVYEFAAREDDEDTADSHVSMYSELLFFPRHQVPTIQKAEDRAHYLVTLPTGERVLWDAQTHEIAGGVLKEAAPIDTNRNRHARKFADVQYLGRGILLRVNQRGNSTRAAEVWGEKKFASIHASIDGKPKSSRVPVSEIFDQSLEGLPFRFAEDDDFFGWIEKKCGWKIDRTSLPTMPTQRRTPETENRLDPCQGNEALKRALPLDEGRLPNLRRPAQEEY